MQFCLKLILTTLLATTAIASSHPDAAADDGGGNIEVYSVVTAQKWTIESMKRVCHKGDNSCDWSFGIKDGGHATPCKFTVKRKDSKTPASHSSNTKGSKCGPYTVTSGWSDHFGKDKGFTTLSIISKSRKQIAHPAYTDKELAGGKVVKPNRAYPVQKLPAALAV